MHIGILEKTNFSKSAISRMGVNNEINDLTDWIHSPVIREDIDVLFVRLKYYLGEQVLKFFPNLKIICSPTTGLNHIDLGYLDRKEIRLISLKGQTEFLKNIRATPEHTLGLIISLFRNYRAAFNPQLVVDRDYLRGKEVFDTRFGLIGMGRVGNVLSNYLSAMGGKVSYYDPFVNRSSHSKISSLQELIESNECIVLCCNHTTNNSNLIDENLLLKMKNKYFINTARGELVNQAALLNLIEKDFFAGVALDVIAEETADGLVEMRKAFVQMNSKNIIFTPHMAGATFESMIKTENFIVEELLKSECEL